ncbi:PRC-barrel domain-containing protein [Candidatus Peregrinibacteria bacterium]|nr:PRC-barrel domain-containing protein [Candidatus Peregrinibacteria bacterium]
MIIHYLDSIGIPLLHFETGELLGMIQDFIIRTETGRIEGFWVKTVAHPFKNLIIQTHDIVGWKKNIYLKDPARISEPYEIIRIAQILEKGIEVIGNRVITEEKKYLGKVYDFDFNTDDFLLRTICVEKRFLWFSYQRRIISSDAIIEILSAYIKVKEFCLKKSNLPLEEPILEV